MRDGLLYAFAALGAVTVARWIIRRAAQAVLRRPTVWRRYQRALCRSTIEAITDPAFHDELQRFARDLSEDLDLAVSSAFRPPRA